MLAGDGAVQLQVTVGELEESGRYDVCVYSREDRSTGEGEPEQEWQCHARGVLSDSSDGEPVGVDAAPAWMAGWRAQMAVSPA